MSQTRFVKHLVKYDGDYGKGELETRCAALNRSTRSTPAATIRR